MGTTRRHWAGAIGLGVALGLAVAGAATPDAVLAGGVEIASHRAEGSRGQWSGEHRRFSPSPYWRQGHDRYGYQGYRGDRHWGDSGYWPYRRHYYDSWGSGAPVYVPGQWVWNGWGWVWVPGYWVPGYWR